MLSILSLQMNLISTIGRYTQSRDVLKGYKKGNFIRVQWFYEFLYPRQLRVLKRKGKKKKHETHSSVSLFSCFLVYLPTQILRVYVLYSYGRISSLATWGAPRSTGIKWGTTRRLTGPELRVNLRNTFNGCTTGFRRGRRSNRMIWPPLWESKLPRYDLNFKL